MTDPEREETDSGSASDTDDGPSDGVPPVAPAYSTPPTDGLPDADDD